MPFSNQSSLGVSAQSLPVLQERYALRRCMAETALGKLYWAEDLKENRDNGELANVLVFTVLPELTQNPVFEQAFGHALSSYQQPAPSMPRISDDGKTPQGMRWMVIRNISGMLLSERLAELDERGMPVQETLELLDSLAAAINHYRPEGVYGFMEPGSVLLGEKEPCLLAAPVVTALRAAYHSGAAGNTRHTLHSAYVSPEILLGDRPTPQDDTFSIACIAYHLLQGESAYNRHSTLEAAVRGITPASIRKLRPEAWITLQQGLDLKRDKRQKAPSILLRELRRKQKKKLMLPIAALVAATAVAFSTYHLLTSWGGSEAQEEEEQALPSQETLPDNSENSANEATPKQAEAMQLQEEPSPPAQEKDLDLTPAEANPALSGIDSLLEKSSQAIHEGNLTSSDPNKPAAVDHLRKIVDIDPENEAARELLLQLVDDQHTEAAALLAADDTDAAKSLLKTTDRIITEFTLAPSLKRQVELETAINQQQRKQDIATTGQSEKDPADNEGSSTEQFLERARAAIDKGKLTEGDEEGESAAAYLGALLEKSPDNPEALTLLKEIANAQQKKALAHLRRRDVEKARAELDASQKLIGKYQLENLVEEQISLEKLYRETQAMGIFPMEQKPEPVEVQVSPDLPIESTLEANRGNELPPVDITTPVVPPLGAPEPANGIPSDMMAEPTQPETLAQPAVTPIPIKSDTAIFQVPAAGNNTANGNTTFIPDVPDLIEVPLDVITDSLPNSGREGQ